MHIISALLFAMSTNLDCLPVGLSYGIKSIVIDKKSNAIVATIATSGTLIAMLAGSFITNFISIRIANLIGSSILIVIGVITILAPLLKREQGIKNYDKDCSGKIDTQESLLLGFALSINNMGLGIGASIAGLPVIYTCLFTFLFSFIFIQVSQYVSKIYISKYITRYASLISGLIILILGLLELII